MEEVTVEDLTEVVMKIRKRMMRQVAVRIKGKIISTFFVIGKIGIRKEEEEGKDQEEEVFMELVSIVVKKGIMPMNVPNAKE